MTYVICGLGLIRLISEGIKNTNFLNKKYSGDIIISVFIILWSALSYIPLRKNADWLTNGWVGAKERERVYACAAIWAGRHIKNDLVIAANEIGAIRFFMPPNSSLIDMFGLLRNNETLTKNYIDLIKVEQPQLIYSRDHFDSKEVVKSELSSSYDWYKFKSLDIGLRSDLEQELAPYLVDISFIYDTLNIKREYKWKSRK
ncbi:MAG: hypothetical protein GF401_15690 [Chitinivibrionales bacterium]|nr:hypothetical protein [Chitinivibrionales bacterium]